MQLTNKLCFLNPDSPFKYYFRTYVVSS